MKKGYRKILARWKRAATPGIAKHGTVCPCCNVYIKINDQIITTDNDKGVTTHMHRKCWDVWAYDQNQPTEREVVITP